MNRKLRRFQDRTSSLSIQHRVPFGEKSTPCATAVTQLKCYTGSIIILSGGFCRGNCGGLKFENRLLFLHRHLSRFKWNFGGKTRGISDCRVCSFYPAYESHKICVKPKHCKNSLGVSDQSSKCWKLLEGFNDHFSGYWMHWLFMDFWLLGI